MYEPEQGCAVPGLEGTNLLGSNCTGMVPQGLCFCEDYILVSAYDCGRDGRRQRSVIYVMAQREAGERECLTTLVLPDVNHVGGLAYDGNMSGSPRVRIRPAALLIKKGSMRR